MSVNLYDKANDKLTQIAGNAKGGGVEIDDTTISTNKVYSSSKIDSLLGSKVNVEDGKGLSTEDYSTAEKTKVGTIGDVANLETTEKTNIVGAINELKNSVSDGKTVVAGAITAKGVATASTDSFATMATNIGSIQTGGNYQTKTVTPSTTAQTVTPDTGYDAMTSVTVSAIATETKTATPKTADQTISPTSGKYLTSVTVKGVSVPAATNILTGSNVTSNSTTLVSGSMANKAGAIQTGTASIASSKLAVKPPATGYYDTTSVLQVDVGTATQAQVLSGKTFTSTAGVKKSGTMADKSDTSTKATTVTTDDTNVYLNIPANGYYTTSSKIYTENSNLMNVGIYSIASGTVNVEKGKYYHFFTYTNTTNDFITNCEILAKNTDISFNLVAYGPNYIHSYIFRATNNTVTLSGGGRLIKLT